MQLINFDFRKKKIKSWNNTLSSKAIIVYPKDIKELTKLIKFLKDNKKNYLIRTGSCSYDSKSINTNLDNIVISLKYINKISKINLKKRTIEVEAGALLSDVIKKIKKKNITLYSVPGGNNISIGGAISANVIGKDSSKTIASFGDAILSLYVIDENGLIKKIKKNKITLNSYIGGFGMAGIILKAELRVKKITSPNLKITSKILKNKNEVLDDFKINSDYHYIQIDPFFRTGNFAISFRGYSTKFKEDIFRNINLKTYKIEELLFKFLGLFINFITWRIFYKLFFMLNKKKDYVIDIHNFHYSSKYKHLIPLVCKNGLVDYEILIRKNFIKTFDQIVYFLKKNKVYPIYVILKRIHKTKNKYHYSFNKNGFALAISMNKLLLKKNFILSFNNFLYKNNLEINLSKTDEKFVKYKKNKNYLFSSLYKKMLLNHHEISG